MLKDLKDIAEDTSFEKTCPICQRVFERKPGLSDKVWNARHYCSRPCGFASRRNPNETRKSNLRRRKDLTKTPFYNFNDN